MWNEYYLHQKKWKTLWMKEKMLVTNIFFFSQKNSSAFCFWVDETWDSEVKC